MSPTFRKYLSIINEGIIWELHPFRSQLLESKPVQNKIGNRSEIIQNIYIDKNIKYSQIVVLKEDKYDDEMINTENILEILL